MALLSSALLLIGLSQPDFDITLGSLLVGPVVGIGLARMSG
jgi:hypothetical protein